MYVSQVKASLNGSFQKVELQLLDVLLHNSGTAPQIIWVSPSTCADISLLAPPGLVVLLKPLLQQVGSPLVQC